MAKRDDHISEKARSVVSIKEKETIDISDLHEFNQAAIKLALDHCIKCNTCKYAFGPFTPSCPSGEKFLWESYWASGRIRIARGILTEKLEINNEVIEPIFACITCGSCQDQCQATHQDRIVDIFEALRELVVKRIGAPERHKALSTRITENNNPYGEVNSNNADLKKKHELPDEAEIAYFIGCTSNYRQQHLRDSTISVFKKLGIDFTLIDEYCCGSPIIRTGQTDPVDSLIQHNMEEFRRAGCKTIVTSCAGCYRTLKKDFPKFDESFDYTVIHTLDLIASKLKSDDMRSFEKRATYHDPCHLGHHLGWYDVPRQVISKIPGLEFEEMDQNRQYSWCCGAGGGVKIGYPDFALETAEKRIGHAENKKADVLLSTCPFCKTNLSDAAKSRESRVQVLDIIEVLDEIL